GVGITVPLQCDVRVGIFAKAITTERARGQFGPARSPVAGSIRTSAPATAAGAGQSCTFVPASAGSVNARHSSAGKVPPNTGPLWNCLTIGTRIVGNPFQTDVVSVGVMPT